MRTQISICIFLYSDGLASTLTGLLARDRYVVTTFKSDVDFVQFVEREKQLLDCLILEDRPALQPLATGLRLASILLPAAIVGADRPQHLNGENNAPDSTNTGKSAVTQIEAQATCFYHPAEVKVSRTDISQIAGYIDRAIGEYLNLSLSCDLTNHPQYANASPDTTTQNFLMQQQRRLADKLKERLGYLGVYYKRNPQRFLRHLHPAEKQEFLQSLKADYRDVILNYFSKDDALNQKIDDFVNQAFFSDVPVTNIVEIHMELMDDFAKQLKLEGRSEEVLLDYRLTLIDTIAHLCEMYRRSIPKES